MIKAPSPGRRSPASTAVSHRQAHTALLALANPNKATFQAGFFKTRKGQYAEGDRFLGIMVPAIRQLARQFRQLSLTDCERLLESPFNDERLLSLLILVEHYRKGDGRMKRNVPAVPEEPVPGQQLEPGGQLGSLHRRVAPARARPVVPL